MINQWYATPVYHSRIAPPAFYTVQTDFKTVIEKLKADDKFQKHPHWHKDTHHLSDPTFYENLVEAYNLTSFKTELHTHVLSYLTKLNVPGLCDFVITESWATLTKTGEFAKLHTHGDSDMSGVYYYKTSGEDGRLYFRNPNRFITNSYIYGQETQDEIEVRPRTGDLLIFPGWLEHGVRENTTSDERISISFNIKFNRKKLENESIS